MAARRKSSATLVVVAIFAALGLNAILLLTLVELSGLDDDTLLVRPLSVPLEQPQRASTDDERPIEISTLVDELRRPDTQTAEEKRREEEAKKEEQDKDPHGQVVDVARPVIEERPDKANYVSEYNTRVEHETKGPQGRDHAGARDGSPPLIQPTPQGDGGKLAQPSPQPSGRPGRSGPQVALHEPQPAVPRSSQEAFTPDRDGDRPRPSTQAPSPLRHAPPKVPEQAGENGEGAPPESPSAPSGKPGERRPNLQPTPEMLARAIAKGGGSVDYLRDVDDGDATALNSKKWKHAPFFNRVKRAVADEWHPEVVYVRHDPNGNVYGVKDRVTVLTIHLNPDGKLAAWNVRQSCGVDFLDDEAIEAFRRAAPFPNPPKDLVESDGKIHFNFAFIFELSGHSVKLFRYN